MHLAAISIQQGDLASFADDRKAAVNTSDKITLGISDLGRPGCDPRFLAEKADRRLFARCIAVSRRICNDSDPIFEKRQIGNELAAQFRPPVRFQSPRRKRLDGPIQISDKYL